ncbi:MAG: formimidoylglutamase [Salibacteraceae bacterium]
MEFSNYFEPFGDQIISGAVFPLSVVDDDTDLSQVDVVIFSVCDTRWTNSADEKHLIDNTLRCFGNLHPGNWIPRVGLLGNFVPGNEPGDTITGLADVVKHCLQTNTIPLILCNSNRVLVGIYKAFVKLETAVNICLCDARIGIGVDTGGVMGEIARSQPNFLFNYSNLGYQTYFTPQAEIELTDSLYFDAVRLGELRGNIPLTEPMIRSSEVFALSVNGLKNSDFKSANNGAPNGFYSEEACQMMRYAGFNEKLKVATITELMTKSLNTVDAELLAEMIWCFLDGFYSKRAEIPEAGGKSFLKYRVSLKDDEFEIIFYKSLKTDRWWMEVPLPPAYENRYRRHRLVPCDYQDYLMATRDEIPDRWWKTYKKML